MTLEDILAVLFGRKVSLTLCNPLVAAVRYGRKGLGGLNFAGVMDERSIVLIGSPCVHP
jgi:hypothetical protein